MPPVNSFAQFFYRIATEIPGCILGEFSTLKHLQSTNFKRFREKFRGTVCRTFVVPADTFDNVKSKFPIGFFVWRLGNVASATGSLGVSEKVSDLEKPPKPQDFQSPSSESNSGSGVFTSTVADVYDATGQYIGAKNICSYADNRFVIEWLRQFYDKRGERVGYLVMVGTDVQHSNNVFVTSKPSPNDFKKHTYTVITSKNLVQMSLYVAIRHVIEQTWLNDRDQFLWPNCGWTTDNEFQTDCLVLTLFDNVVKSADGVNHWIPFTEKEVNAQGLFKSHFMSDFLAGKADDYKSVSQGDLFADAAEAERKPILFSDEAKAVMDAGRELWRYYHAQPNANPNASFYDIRLHFQGSTMDAKGKTRMNNESSDAKYTELLASLRAAMKCLARRIEPKVYEYGFLKK